MKKILTESELINLIKQVILEQNDLDKLDGTILGQSHFTHNGKKYLLKGYALKYELTNGKKITAFCEKHDANAVYGSSGLITDIYYIKDIEFLDEVDNDDYRHKTFKQTQNFIISTPANKSKITKIKFLLTLKPTGTMTPRFYNKLMENQMFGDIIGPDHIHAKPPYNDTSMDFSDLDL